jgi:hypothetical protein
MQIEGSMKGGIQQQNFSRAAPQTMRVSCQMIESSEMSRIFPHSIPDYQFKNENLQGFVIS